MTGQYRKYDYDFLLGAVRLVTETGKPIAQVARDLGINEGKLGNGMARARVAAGEGCGELREPERADYEDRSWTRGCSVTCSSVRWASGWTRR
jgi:transposase